MNVYNDRAILVTGGAGFIGSHLVEELIRRGGRVTVVDDFSSGRLEHLAAVKDQVQVHRLDLSTDDLGPLLTEQAFEYIFHLAGHASVPASVEHPRKDLERNGLATFNLLESVLNTAPHARLVFASSAAVYGEGSAQPFREGDPTVPIAPYGVSKLAAERYMTVYARVYGLHTASLRLFPVFGPRLHAHVIYDFMLKVFKNPQELFVHGDGTQVRDFTYVTNAVEAFLVVAERAALQGEVYNMGSGNPISISDLAHLLCITMDVAPRLVFSGEVGAGVSHFWSADIARLISLGYTSRTTFAEGLGETVEWFRQDMKTLNALESSL